MNFQRLEDILYLCKLNLYWIEDGEQIDLREAEVVSLKDNELTIKDKKGLYWSWDLDTLEAKVRYLADLHDEEFSAAFKKLREEG